MNANSATRCSAIAMMAGRRFSRAVAGHSSADCANDTGDQTSTAPMQRTAARIGGFANLFIIHLNRLCCGTLRLSGESNTLPNLFRDKNLELRGVGQTVTHYKILEKLGEGGMGLVYRGVDTRLDRPVPIKFFRPEAVGSTERRRHFILEAKAASALNHPHIITIYDIGQHRY